MGARMPGHHANSVGNFSWSPADERVIVVPTPTEEEPMDGKDVARRLYDEVFNARRVEVLDEIATPDYDEHSPLPGQGNGLDGLKQRVAMLIDALDPHFTIEDMVAEGDRVAVRWTWTGTGFVRVP